MSFLRFDFCEHSDHDGGSVDDLGDIDNLEIATVFLYLHNFQLESPVTFSDFTRPICLPTMSSWLAEVASSLSSMSSLSSLPSLSSKSLFSA